MTIKYIDIHSHLNLSPFTDSIEDAIKKLEVEGVATICVGTDLASSKRAIEIAEMSDYIWATVGQHPTDTNDAFDEAAFLELAKHSKVVAIGECGLDYFRTPKNAPLHGAGENTATIFDFQKDIFLKQIAIAQKVQKPLMIHARPSKSMMDAYEDTLEILSNFPGVRANFHFFVGDTTIAAKALAAGHTMSFDGPITFTNEYDSVIAALPLSAMMAETDAPFAAPEPYRSANKTVRTDGKTMPALCEPWMVKEVVTRIALLKNADLETVRLAMIENAKQFFKILL